MALHVDLDCGRRSAPRTRTAVSWQPRAGLAPQRGGRDLVRTNRSTGTWCARTDRWPDVGPDGGEQSLAEAALRTWWTCCGSPHRPRSCTRPLPRRRRSGCAAVALRLARCRLSYMELSSPGFAQLQRAVDRFEVGLNVVPTTPMRDEHETEHVHAPPGPR
jgi:hypothetical protein